MTDYLIPYRRVQREIRVVNSRFIATLGPAEDVDAARAFIAELRRQYADATHNVPAYIIGGGNSVTEYASDDGEPSGTAGRPALTVLRGSGLGDVVLVITRYFGGTKLGTGGLVRAYTRAAQAVVEAVPRARRETVRVALLAVPYPLLEPVRRLCHEMGVSIVDEAFAAEVTLTVHAPLAQWETWKAQLQERSAGRIEPVPLEERQLLIPVQPT